jgi:hypothetical protein
MEEKLEGPPGLDVMNVNECQRTQPQTDSAEPE